MSVNNAAPACPLLRLHDATIPSFLLVFLLRAFVLNSATFSLENQALFESTVGQVANPARRRRGDLLCGLL